jgi:hypothetical protein
LDYPYIEEFERRKKRRDEEFELNWEILAKAELDRLRDQF